MRLPPPPADSAISRLSNIGFSLLCGACERRNLVLTVSDKVSRVVIEVLCPTRLPKASRSLDVLGRRLRGAKAESEFHSQARAGSVILEVAHLLLFSLPYKVSVVKSLRMAYLVSFSSNNRQSRRPSDNPGHSVVIFRAKRSEMYGK